MVVEYLLTAWDAPEGCGVPIFNMRIMTAAEQFENMKAAARQALDRHMSEYFEAHPEIEDKNYTAEVLTEVYDHVYDYVEVVVHCYDSIGMRHGLALKVPNRMLGLKNPEPAGRV